MKTILKEILTSRVVIITSIGCLLIIGCLKVIDQITQETVVPDTQAEFGPVSGNSREPYKHPVFTEPSLEGLVAELKKELGVQDVDIDVEAVAAANTLYTLNFTDSRLPPEEVQAAWIERKKLVIAYPELLWTPGFTLPPIVLHPNDQPGYPLGMLFDYDVEYGVDFIVTEEQLERIYAIRDQISSGMLSEEEVWQLRRERAMIRVENASTLTAAKYFLRKSSIGSIELELGREYAERAFNENPNSVEALHVWVLCLPTEEEEAGFRRMLDEFPNSALAHIGLAITLCYDLSRPEEGLIHIQKAIQLDSRIPRYNYLLAECYGRSGDYEKALAVYQGVHLIENHITHESLVEYQLSVYVQRMQNENGDVASDE